nr:MAG: hypothetical protein J07AB56_01540 [Candidatus Nanosalinarum sp. J07AB56]
MTEHEEVLEGTVDEAKDSIRNLDDPDYESLLEAEKEDKNRKTLVSWLESRAYEESHEEGTEEEAEQENSGDEGEQGEPEQVDEAVEEVERQTAGGLGGGFSSGQIALGGLLVGLIIGLASGTLVGDTGMSAEPGASTSQIQEDVRSLVSQGQTQDVSIASVERRNEMFFVNVSGTVTQNGTSQEINRAFYVSQDGELLFPQISSPFFRSPINIADSLATARNQTGAGQ